MGRRSERGSAQCSSRRGLSRRGTRSSGRSHPVRRDRLRTSQPHRDRRTDGLHQGRVVLPLQIEGRSGRRDHRGTACDLDERGGRDPRDRGSGARAVGDARVRDGAADRRGPRGAGRYPPDVGDERGGRPTAPYLDWIDGLREVFQAAIEEGDIADTVDSAELARYFVSAFTGVQMVSNVLTGRADLDARLDQMVSFVLASVVAPRRRHKIDRYVHTGGARRTREPVRRSAEAPPGGWCPTP